MSSLLQFLRKTPRFAVGDMVNLAPLGVVTKADGLVLAVTGYHVLVEWPRTAAEWLAAHTLTLVVDSTKSPFMASQS